MENKKTLYEPVLNFRKNKPQMQIETIKHEELYKQAFFSAEEKSQSEYAQNTSTWD